MNLQYSYFSFHQAHKVLRHTLSSLCCVQIMVHQLVLRAKNGNMAVRSQEFSQSNGCDLFDGSKTFVFIRETANAFVYKIKVVLCNFDLPL